MMLDKITGRADEGAGFVAATLGAIVVLVWNSLAAGRT